MRENRSTARFENSPRKTRKKSRQQICVKEESQLIARSLLFPFFRHRLSSPIAKLVFHFELILDDRRCKSGGGKNSPQNFHRSRSSERENQGRLMAAMRILLLLALCSGATFAESVVKTSSCPQQMGVNKKHHWEVEKVFVAFPRTALSN